MTLFDIHFVRLHWHLALALAFNVGIRVVKRVLVVPASDTIHRLQCLDCARKLAHVYFGQHVSHSWIGGLESGQDGSLIANMVAHVGGNRSCNESVVGSSIGTKVGKHVVVVLVVEKR